MLKMVLIWKLKKKQLNRNREYRAFLNNTTKTTCISARGIIVEITLLRQKQQDPVTPFIAFAILR